MEIATIVVRVLRTLFCMASKVNCGRRIAVLVPKGCGKTTLVQKMNPDDKKAILCDIEQLASIALTPDQKETLSSLQRSQEWQNIKLFLLPIWKTFLQDLMVKFKHSSVLVFTSSPEALSHLEISRKEVYVPSQSFFDEILSKVSDEPKKRAMVQSRNEIISAYGSRAKVYSSFFDLEKMVSDDMGLSAKI